MELMAAEDNKNGGLSIGGERYNVELIVYDNNNNQNTEVAAINRLIFEDKVNFILTQGLFEASWISITEANKVIVMSQDPMAFIDLAPTNHYSFNPTFSDPEIPAKTGWFCKNYPNQAKNMVTAFIDNQFGHMISVPAGMIFKAFGVTPTVVFYPANQVDLSAVGTKIASLNPGAVMCMSGGSATDGLGFNAVYQAGYRGQLFSPTNNPVSVWLQVASPEALEGFITGLSCTETDPALTKTGQQFKELWIAEYGKWEDPLTMGMAVYPCLRTALEKAGSLDTEKVVAVLNNGMEFSAPTGDGKMISRPDLGNDRTVDSISTYYMKLIKNGKAELLATISMDEALNLFQTSNPAAPPPGAAPTGPPPAAGAVIPWKDALELTNFGDTVTVTGVVIDVMAFMPPETVLFTGEAGGNPMSSFPVAIADPSKGFPDPATYKGKTIEATGKLSKNPMSGKAGLTVTDPSQIVVK
jgi:branched-chain amino acid transport system substrate-binding protein